ncbi:MAG: response regulator transcription factor [Rhodothermales bacterium]|nr:response regulator transcription factor [Rhodothermales bacterium]
MNVVICDDSILVRQHLRNVIQRMPDVSLVGEASTAGQSLAMMKSLKPDVAIMDIQFPDGNGVDVLRKVKVALPRLNVVMLTNHVNDMYKRACLQAGAAAFLDKSREFDRVSETLSDLAQG